VSANVIKRCGCRRPDGSKWGNACPQLRRADGSWNPSHGSWSYRLELDPDDDGNRRVLRRSGFASQKDALAALDQAKGADLRGVDVTRKVTMRDYLREWMDGKRDLRATTRRSYEQHIHDLWALRLGRLDVSAVRRAHIEAALATLSSSAATRVRYLATLKSALHDALREGLITVNPATLARVESGKRPKIRPLEPDELGRLLDHLASDPLGAFYETVAATGLRRGEALALRWDDVDLGRGRLVDGSSSSSSARVATTARTVRPGTRGCCSPRRRPRAVRRASSSWTARRPGSSSSTGSVRTLNAPGGATPTRTTGSSSLTRTEPLCTATR
jgi:Arm DNA-binding domain